MAILYKNFKNQLKIIFPVFLLYFLSITELDTYFENYFEILSFNLQLIVIYYWVLKSPSIIGNGNIFFAGIINDVIMGLPLGTSPLSYLITCLVASYIRNVTVNKTLFTDWLTFSVAVFFSNLVFFILLSNFSNLEPSYSKVFYNSFFTFMFFPFFWALFNLYNSIMRPVIDD